MVNKLYYMITDIYTGKKYGPVFLHKTANLIANEIDSKYGAISTEITINKNNEDFNKITRSIN